MILRFLVLNGIVKKNLTYSKFFSGIGLFFNILEYKATWQGKSVIKLDPKYTSQKCSSCGHISKENRKSQSNFLCVKCGHKEHADINASKNILAGATANVRKRKASA